MTPEHEQVEAAEARVLEAEAKKVEGQVKMAWVAFGIGTIILIVTVGAPIAISLVPVLQIGCKTVTIEAVPTLVCATVSAPWGFTTGLVAGMLLYAMSAAFKQVQVGDVGKGLLAKLPGFGGKPKE